MIAKSPSGESTNPNFRIQTATACLSHSVNRASGGTWLGVSQGGLNSQFDV